MILLSFIIQGHPSWKKGKISIFQLCKPGTTIETRKELEELISAGRQPITTKNIEIIEAPELTIKGVKVEVKKAVKKVVKKKVVKKVVKEDGKSKD